MGQHVLLIPVLRWGFQIPMLYLNPLAQHLNGCHSAWAGGTEHSEEGSKGIVKKRFTTLVFQ